jgi:hypothetical protein
MSIFDVSTIGTAANKITFNGNTFPLYRVISRAPQQRQLRDMDIPIPFEDGITDFQTLEGSSAYIIQGTMYPGDEQSYDQGLAALRKLASLDIEQSDVSSDAGYVPYIYTEYAQNKQIFLKVLYVDLPESTRKGLVQPFRLVCKVKDPTIFSATASLASTQSSDPTLSGGSALFPFSFPVLFGASTYSTSSIATNNGDLDGFPTSIKVYGPINTPTITNGRTGEYITVNVNISSGSVLTIAYDKDSLSVDVDGVSKTNKVTANSTYFKLKPGGNPLTLTGTTFSSGAYLEVAYYSTWPLS